MTERRWIVAPRSGYRGGFLRAPSLRAAVWEANERGWRVFRESFDEDGDRVWAMEPGAMVEQSDGRFGLRLAVLDGYDRASEPAAESIGLFAAPPGPVPVALQPARVADPAPMLFPPPRAAPTKPTPTGPAQRGLFS